jgi:hypothetical protein
MVEARPGMNVQTDQADRARDELGPGWWKSVTELGVQTGSVTGPNVQARDDFHARRSGRPGPARDDRGLQILSRSRDEKYWGLNFGSLHTPVWGRLPTKGNKPEEVITPDPSLNWKHQNKKRTDGSLI